MSKYVVLGLLAIGGTLMVTDQAEARWRRSCCGVATACAVPTCAMSDCGTSACGTSACGSAGCSACSSSYAAPATIVDGNSGTTTVTQNPNGSYQSFSYEPGTTAPATTAAPAPVYQAAPQRSSGYSEYNSVLRGDRKFRGLGN